MKITKDDILSYDLKVIDDSRLSTKKYLNGIFSFFNQSKKALILYIYLKNKEEIYITNLSNKVAIADLKTAKSKCIITDSNGYDILEFKNYLDSMFMNQDRYINIHEFYKKYIELLEYNYKNITLYSDIDDSILSKLYSINKSSIHPTIRTTEISVDGFDLYYDSSYRFFTWDGAWEACSNRRDRMERESETFLSNYRMEVEKNLFNQCVERINSYLKKINEYIKNNNIQLSSKSIKIVLDSNYIVTLNTSNNILNIQNKENIKNYLFYDYTSNTTRNKISVGSNDYEITDNGKMLLGKAYGYVIYKENVKKMLKETMCDIESSYNTSEKIENILCIFIQEITNILKDAI